jgi:PAS domain S-box-containing protein
LRITQAQRSPLPSPSHELTELRARLAEAQETLRAIGSGEVDAVMIGGKRGEQVFTLEGAEHAYRVLIESMNEGALTLAGDEVILYANRSFARLVKQPLEKVTGASFRTFLIVEDRAKLRSCLRHPGKSGRKVQVLLLAGDGSRIPAQVSVRPMAKNGSKQRTFGVVVTDMTEAHRSEGQLRALTHRVVQAQEAERSRVALELHDNITQLLCGTLFCGRALAGKLLAGAKPLNEEAMRLCNMIGETADAVERISRNLRPSVLEDMGLVVVLQGASAAFKVRTGVSIKLACSRFTGRLPAAVELALYRILQEALRNVEEHACAHHVAVRLFQEGSLVHMEINDDGVGFDMERLTTKSRGRRRLGLIGMRERASYVDGAFEIRSSRRTGTIIDVRIPLAGAGQASAAQAASAA